jgi:hypothetical protein
VGTTGGGSRIYAKGSFVLGMLSHVVGHDDFQRAVKAYLNKFAYKNANTNDFYLSFYDALGLNLDWFFDEWLYRGGEPDYHVHYDALIKDNKPYTQVYIDQVQPVSEFTGYFKMPIKVEVHYTDGSVASKEEWVENQHHIMQIPDSGGKEIDFVLFDPNYTVMKHVTFDKSLTEWQSQALRAPNMLDKYEALLALRNQPVKDKIEVLTKVYNNAKFHALREEILYQLSNDPSQEAKNIFKQGVADREASVRLSAVNNTKSIPVESRLDYEPLLNDSSYDVIEMVLPKLCDAFPQNKLHYLLYTQDLIGLNHSLRVTWLALRIQNRNLQKDSSGQGFSKGFISDSAAIAELDDYTSNSFEFRSRANAFKGLEQINYLDHRSATGLLDAAICWNGRLANPAKETLQFFNRQLVWRQLIREEIENGKWTPEQKEKLSKLF